MPAGQADYGRLNSATNGISFRAALQKTAKAASDMLNKLYPAAEREAVKIEGVLGSLRRTG